MQIEIDFDVFKSLTSLRQNESDTYNSVVRRLLKLPDVNQIESTSRGGMPRGVLRGPMAMVEPKNVEARLAELGETQRIHFGTWFGNTNFPEQTQFRATYKGQTYLAEIRGGKWMGADGVVRRSPSDAAGAISGTNVNGWRFWHVLRPGETEWSRLDEVRQ